MPEHEALTARRAYAALADVDPVLAGLMDQWGTPDPFTWTVTAEVSHGRGQAGNLDAMVLHILRQQVSLASADAAYDRLAALLGGTVSASALAATTTDELRGAGLTRQKAAYLQTLGLRQATGVIDLERMEALSDDEAVAALVSLPGVGRWTAEVFLINQLHRIDVLPAADLGLQRAAMTAYGLEARPGERELRERGERWAPYRTYAAHLLWFSLPEVYGLVERRPTPHSPAQD